RSGLMRILYLTHAFFPESSLGTERLTLDMAAAMQRAGHHVRVATWSQATQGDYVYEGVPVTAFGHAVPPWDVHLSLDDDPGLRAWAAGFLSRNGYDVLHVMHTMRTAPFLLAAMDCKLPYVVTLNDYHALCYRANLLTFAGKPCAGPRGGQ